MERNLLAAVVYIRNSLDVLQVVLLRHGLHADVVKKKQTRQQYIHE